MTIKQFVVESDVTCFGCIKRIPTIRNLWTNTFKHTDGVVRKYINVVIQCVSMNIIYTLPDCPNCILLKDFLRESKIDFVEFPMDDAHSITEMRFDGCFSIAAPVLRTNKGFFETDDLFKEGKINEDKTRDVTK